MRVRTGSIALAVAATVTSLLAGCTPPDSYVALGDSFTAGPAILPKDLSVPGCLRSDANYPNLVAPEVGQPAFRDVSCSGAKTGDMTASQDVDPNPDPKPQLDALDRNTRVITLGIGGNDIGFVEIAKKCGELGLSNPNGSPCRDFYTSGGVDQIGARIEALAPKLRAVLDKIDDASPNAKVFVVGYPAILPENTIGFTACRPTLPIATGDVAYLRDGVQKRLNSTIRSVAETHGEVYVDTYTPSIGHDACKPPTVRWVEPVIPAADAAPVHPNRLGMQGMAGVVEATMAANGVGAG